MGGEALGASTAPQIGGAAGDRVAFVSTAANLVSGFVDSNGAEPDVFVGDPTMGTVRLVSHAQSSAATGGNGRSSVARIDPGGSVIAFESDATDLLADGTDSNGVRDVFYAADSDLVVRRASVASGGGEASGGASSEPSIYVASVGGADGPEVRIAFTSAKTTLVGDTLGAAQNVYLFDSRNGGRTTLLSRIAGPSGTLASDGELGQPADRG